MKKIRNIFLIAIGFGFVGLGWLGVVVPGLPTVVFLIIALACFAKSSKRFHKWLYNHKIFGGQLQLWDKHGVIPPIAKIAAVLSMLASGVYLAFFSEISFIGLASAIIFMAVGAVYILSRPSYPPN